MAEFSFQEPVYLALGRELYEQYEEKKTGNVVSILSDAMTTLRQLGIVGLDLWIDSNNGEREFIRTAMQGETAARLGLARRLKSMEERKKEQETAQSIDAVWSDMESLIRVLRYAKYYAKTQEKND